MRTVLRFVPEACSFYYSYPKSVECKVLLLRGVRQKRSKATQI